MYTTTQDIPEYLSRVVEVKTGFDTEQLRCKLQSTIVLTILQLIMGNGIGGIAIKVPPVGAPVAQQSKSQGAKKSKNGPPNKKQSDQPHMMVNTTQTRINSNNNLQE